MKLDEFNWEKFKNEDFRSNLMDEADADNFFSGEQREFLTASLNLILESVTPKNFLTATDYLEKLHLIIFDLKDKSHQAIKELADYRDFEQRFKYPLSLVEKKKKFFFKLLEKEYEFIKEKLAPQILKNSEPSSFFADKSSTKPRLVINSPHASESLDNDLDLLQKALYSALDSFLKSDSAEKMAVGQLATGLCDQVEDSNSFDLAANQIKNFLEDNKILDEYSFSSFLIENVKKTYNQLSPKGQYIMSRFPLFGIKEKPAPHILQFSDPFSFFTNKGSKNSKFVFIHAPRASKPIEDDIALLQKALYSALGSFLESDSKEKMAMEPLARRLCDKFEDYSSSFDLTTNSSVDLTTILIKNFLEDNKTLEDDSFSSFLIDNVKNIYHQLSLYGKYSISRFSIFGIKDEVSISNPSSAVTMK